MNRKRLKMIKICSLLGDNLIINAIVKIEKRNI